MPAAGQKPGACDVHGKAETGYRYRFREVNLDGSQEADDGFVADEDCDHGENDGAGEAGRIPDFTSSEGEVGIRRVAARIGISERRKEEGAGVRAHVQTIRHQGD